MQEGTLNVYHQKFAGSIPSSSRHNVGQKVSGGRQRGTAGVEIFSLVVPCELLGDKSASDLVTLLDVYPSEPNEFPFWIVMGLGTGDLVPHMHLGHEPHIFVAPCLDL